MLVRKSHSTRRWGKGFLIALALARAVSHLDSDTAVKASFASRESLCERIEGGVVSSDEAGSVRQNAAAIIPAKIGSW